MSARFILSSHQHQAAYSLGDAVLSSVFTQVVSFCDLERFRHEVSHRQREADRAGRARADAERDEEECFAGVRVISAVNRADYSGFEHLKISTVSRDLRRHNREPRHTVVSKTEC